MHEYLFKILWVKHWNMFQLCQLNSTKVVIQNLPRLCYWICCSISLGFVGQFVVFDRSGWFRCATVHSYGKCILEWRCMESIIQIGDVWPLKIVLMWRCISLDIFNCCHGSNFWEIHLFIISNCCSNNFGGNYIISIVLIILLKSDNTKCYSKYFTKFYELETLICLIYLHLDEYVTFN